MILAKPISSLADITNLLAIYDISSPDEIRLDNQYTVASTSLPLILFIKADILSYFSSLEYFSFISTPIFTVFISIFSINSNILIAILASPSQTDNMYFSISSSICILDFLAISLIILLIFSSFNLSNFITIHLDIIALFNS